MTVVRVWQWDLDAAAEAADRAVLSDLERARADRYLVAHAGPRFAAGRAGMRRVLGAIRGEDPQRLHIQAGDNGKPFVTGGPEFNLSHSGPVALFAVAPFPVGIDVEAVRAVEDGLARMVFTPAEQAVLAGMPATAFFDGWTRKEAVIKAAGGSIADLQATTVLPDAPAGWLVQSLAAPPGYLAAVAAQRTGWTVSREPSEIGAG